jgi:hypothetical protein
MDESVPEECIDWSKAFTNVENMVNTNGSYVLRKGAPTLATTDSTSTSLAPIFRLASTQGGLGVVGASYQLYHLNETTQQLINKGRLPEFSHQRIQVGGTSEVSTITGVAGVAITTNYYCIAYMGESTAGGSTVTQLIIDILDQSSHNVVTSLAYTSTALHAFAMVGVDSRYLHIYQSLAGGSTKPQMFVIDTQSLPANPVLSPSFTQFTSSANGDYVMGVCAISGNSVAVITGTNMRIEKFNNSAVSAANAAVTGFTSISGLDTDGTNFYVAGRLVNNTDPSGLTLTFWNRGSYTASPWNGTASAGTSGSNALTEATNPPTTGTAVNGFTPALFNSTTSTIGNSTALPNPSVAGTIILLVKMNSSSPERTLFNMVAAAATKLSITYNTTTGFCCKLLNVITANIPYPIGRWAMVVLKWTSPTIKMRVNRGDYTVVSGTPANTGCSIFMGVTSGSALDGSVMEVIYAPSELSNGAVDDIREYMNTRYALTL